MTKHMADPECEAGGCIFEHKLSLPLPVPGGLSGAVDDAHIGLQINQLIGQVTVLRPLTFANDSLNQALGIADHCSRSQ